MATLLPHKIKFIFLLTQLATCNFVAVEIFFMMRAAVRIISKNFNGAYASVFADAQTLRASPGCSLTLSSSASAPPDLRSASAYAPPLRLQLKVSSVVAPLLSREQSPSLAVRTPPDHQTGLLQHWWARPRPFSGLRTPQ